MTLRYFSSNVRSAHRVPAILCAAALWLFSGCAFFNPAPTYQQPYLRSFLGVRFGSSLADVQRDYPTATLETSPMGFSCLRIDDQFGQGIRYTRVIYEFSESQGMQLVFARVAPESSGATLDRLKRLLGQPLPRSDVDRQQSNQPSIWLSPEGGQVTFYPARDILVVRNSGSSAFALDVSLRLQDEPIVTRSAAS